jgi:hypothetical protein
MHALLLFIIALRRTVTMRALMPKYVPMKNVEWQCSSGNLLGVAVKFIRSALILLLVAGLAVTPVAKATAAMMDASAVAAQSVAHQHPLPETPDCHGIAHLPEQRDLADHEKQKPGSNESCPDCDKHRSCSADACQLKCFKVFGAFAAERASVANLRAVRYDFASLPTRVPVSWKPRTPPPRS